MMISKLLELVAIYIEEIDTATDDSKNKKSEHDILS